MNAATLAGVVLHTQTLWHKGTLSQFQFDAIMQSVQSQVDSDRLKQEIAWLVQEMQNSPETSLCGTAGCKDC